MDRSQQIVLQLLQDTLTDEARSQISALNEGEWRAVIQAAEAQAVAPLLFRNVQRLQVNARPPIQEQLRQILRDSTARNLRILKVFESLAQALRAQDIAFMPLKGVYLCTNLYENLGERVIWDIDLIVPVSDMRHALQAIDGTGYRASRPYDMELEFKSYHHLPVYVKKDAPPLEIHWTLLNPRFQHGLDFQELWERSVPARVGGAQVQTLSAGDLLIYLCAHVAYQHVYMDSLRSLYDIKLAVRQFSSQLDWDAIAGRAHDWQLLNSLYLSLRLTDNLLGLPLPESAWRLLRPPDFDERFTQAALTRMFEEADVSPVMNAVWARQSIVQRIKGLVDRLALSPSVLAGRYGLPPNSRRVYLYYFVRLKDLLRLNGGDLLELLLGGRKKKDLAQRDSELVAYLKWWQ